MTQRERQILQLIEQNPMVSQQELADRLQITRSSVAVHISNLMKKGHIAGKGYIGKPTEADLAFSSIDMGRNGLPDGAWGTAL